jgi:hypothetical protein
MKLLVIFFLFYVASAYPQQTIDKLNTNQLKLPKESVSKALILDATGQVKSSATVTDTEISYLDGLTDTISNLLSGKANDSDVVKLTTNQSISGTKTFTGKLVASSTINGSTPCPVMNQTQRDAFTASQGDCVYNSTSLKLNIYDGSIWKDAGGAGGVSLWTTATPFIINDVVIESDRLYRCLIAHTSGTFATDLAASRWVEVSASPSTPYSLANGGTNKALTASNGGVVWVDADSFEIVSAGTSGQVLQTNGASSPTWVNKSISAKSQNTTAVTLEEIQVPNKQLTQIDTSKYLVETGNSNILHDPSFESSGLAASWTIPNGSINYGGSAIDGLVAPQLTLISEALSVTQSSTLYQAQFADGVQGLASMRVRIPTSLTTPIYVCSVKNGVEGAVGSGCVRVQNNNKWGLYKVPFILGGTSNGIALTSKGVTFTNVVEFDDAFVGAVDLKVDTNNVSNWQDYTMTIGATVTPPTKGARSVDKAQWRQVGSDMEIRFDYKQTGAGSAGSGIYLFPLPNGYTVDSTRAPSGSADQAVAGVAKMASGTVSDGAATALGQVLISKAFPNNLYINYTQTSVENTANVSSANYPLSGATVGYSFIAKVPVTQFSGAGSTYSASCGANCVDTFSAKISSTGLVSGENSDWISGDCTNANPRVCTFNTNLFTVTPNCNITIFNNEAIAHSEVIRAQSSSSISIYTGFGNFSAVQYATNITCQKQGADFTAARTIVGSFNEVVTTPGIVKPVTYSARVSAAGVVSNEVGNFINGNCTMTNPTNTCPFVSATFSSAPNCTVVLDDNGLGTLMAKINNLSTSSTQVGYVTQIAGANTYQAEDVNIVCHGVSP